MNQTIHTLHAIAGGPQFVPSPRHRFRGTTESKGKTKRERNEKFRLCAGYDREYDRTQWRPRRSEDLQATPEQQRQPPEVAWAFGGGQPLERREAESRGGMWRPIPELTLEEIGGLDKIIVEGSFWEAPCRIAGLVTGGDRRLKVLFTGARTLKAVNGKYQDMEIHLCSPLRTTLRESGLEQCPDPRRASDGTWGMRGRMVDKSRRWLRTRSGLRRRRRGAFERPVLPHGSGSTRRSGGL